MSCAYHQVPLSKEAQKLVSFVIGGLQWKFVRGFYGLSGLPNFFSRIMMLSFRKMIEKKTVLTYIDDLLIMGNSVEEMFTSIIEFHDQLRTSGMKAATDKTFFFQTKIQYLGHMIAVEGIVPIPKIVEAIKKLKSPENKRELMRVV